MSDDVITATKTKKKLAPFYHLIIGICIGCAIGVPMTLFASQISAFFNGG